MSLIQQASMVCASASLLLGVFYLVTRDRLQLRYSLQWLVLAFGALAIALFPNFFFEVGRYFGFEFGYNFILVIGILYLLVTSLSLSSALSRQQGALKNAIQRIALLESEIEKMHSDYDSKG